MNCKWHRLIPALLLLAAILLIAGCGEKVGWRIKVVNEDGKPLPGATVTVWQYFLSEDNPYAEGFQLCKDIGNGVKSAYGWEFTTDKYGKALCDKIPTGGYTATGRTGSTSTQVGDQTVTIPGQRIYTLVPGKWLALTISVPGYTPYYVVFRPNSASGDLGTYKIPKAE